MNKITTQDGSEFEVVPLSAMPTMVDSVNNVTHLQGYGLRPIIKQEKNWEVLVYENLAAQQVIRVDLDNISEKQAQAISGAVEALMEYVFKPIDIYGLREAAMDAAEILQKGRGDS